MLFHVFTSQSRIHVVSSVCNFAKIKLPLTSVRGVRGGNFWVRSSTRVFAPRVLMPIPISPHSHGKIASQNLAESGNTHETAELA